MPSVTERMTVHADREAWLEYRRTRIGASDVPVILGLDGAYGSPWKLFWQKKGFDFGDGDAQTLESGHLQEPIIGEKFQKETGLVLMRPDPYTTVEHPKEPRFFCTPDFFVVIDGEIAGIMQAKAVRLWQKSWGADMRPAWVAQAAFEAECCDLDRAWVAVGVAGVELRQREIELMGEGVHDKSKLYDFLRCLDMDEAPAPEAEDSANVGKVYSAESEGKTIELGHEIMDMVRDMVMHGGRQAFHAAEVDRIKAAIKCRMADAVAGVLPDGSLVTFKTVSRKGYSVEAKTYRELRFKLVGE